MTDPYEPCLCGAEDCEFCFPTVSPTASAARRGYNWYPDDYDPGPEDPDPDEQE